jgi:hypothetical protein
VKESQRDVPVPPPVADTPMWLSHHWPSDYDRCAVVAGRHVCRRCLVLYPLALLAAVLASAGVTWPERLDVWLCWLLPLPAVLELCGEQLGLLRHRPARLVVTTVLLAAACGRLYDRYLDSPGDTLVWTVAVTYAGACVLATLWRSLRPPT